MDLRERVLDALLNEPNLSIGQEGKTVTFLDIINVINDLRLTPKMPSHTRIQYKNGDEWITDECPRCCNNHELLLFDRVINRFDPFCRRCGQAIDWSEYDNGPIDWDKYMQRVREEAKNCKWMDKSEDDK